MPIVEGLIVVGLMIAVVAGCALLIWSRQPREGNELFEMNVVVLGAASAGKTVFLASQAHELGMANESGVYLRPRDGEVEEKLRVLYNRVADTGQDFPEATAKSEIGQWRFALKVKKKGAVDSAFGINYLDFAGESLTGPALDRTALQPYIDGADVLMGMVDGAEILRYLRKPKKSSPYMSTLREMLKLLSDQPKAVHLILTKWDLIEREYEFGEAVRALMAVRWFSRFVDAQRDSAFCRLIPVSSVGTDFAVLRRDGTITKIEGGVPDPINIDIPLACSLPDAIGAAKQQEARGKSQRRGAELLQWAKRARIVVNLGPVSFDLAIPGQDNGNEEDGSPEEAATKEVVQYFMARQFQFVTEFPASDLCAYAQGQTRR